ncbi:hypothetical protein HQ590_07135 [bacterium]|nr:hypothetical protein [bacterium]
MGTHIEDMERGRVEFLDLDGDTPLAREAAASVALDGDTGHCPQCEAWGRRQAELAGDAAWSPLIKGLLAWAAGSRDNDWVNAYGDDLHQADLMTYHRDEGWALSRAGAAVVELLTGHAPGEEGGQDGNG